VELAATPKAWLVPSFLVKSAARPVTPLLDDGAGRHEDQRGTFAIPEALGQKTFHPYGDFLLHDVGTGDGIVSIMEEHYGETCTNTAGRTCLWLNFRKPGTRSERRPCGRPPAYAVDARCASLTFTEAILRHRGEASRVTERFQNLSLGDKEALIEFLRSL